MQLRIRTNYRIYFGGRLNINLVSFKCGVSTIITDNNKMKTKLFTTSFLLLIAFYSLGQATQEWASRYDAFGLAESARAIAIDTSGNVYVTGVSVDPSTGGSGQDYATVKYNSAGLQQWAKRYNGPGNSADAANAIAVDGLGNVIVTGNSMTFGTNWDYFTIKYNSVGDTLWTRRWDSPISASDNSVAVVVDSFNNIYITGSSSEGLFLATNQWATIKYSPAGTVLWQNWSNFSDGTDNYPYAMALKDGFIFITGATTNATGDHDFLTIKQSAVTGDTIWTRTYNGLSGGNDEANDIFADDLGNVYVTGKSQQSGVFSTTDYLTIKYDSSGTELWTTVYDGLSSSFDAAVSVAVDDSGNVFVTGYSHEGGTGYDFTTVKYNGSGVVQWVKHYDDGDEDKASDLALDKNGNIYVTGYSKVIGGTYTQYTTIMYNNDGTQEWVMHYNGPVSAGIDEASAMAIDGSSNVYVTGKSEGTGTSTDYLTIKYSQVTVGIISPEENNFFPGISLFPNPTTTQLTISCSQGTIKNIEIYNVHGQKYSTSIFPLIDGEGVGVNVDVAELSPGIYFVKVNNGEKVYMKKFIVQ